MRPLPQVAAELGLEAIPYGAGAAKIPLADWGPPTGRLVLVTAMTPTAAGEGKTTVAIGLADALRRLGALSAVCLRQPSMGPVFGRKGGGSGAGRAQLVPADRLNLHFTGDMHAVTAAHNLAAAALDNHLHFGNSLELDVRRLLHRRVVDLNDRSLRQIVVGLGRQGVTREDRFDITAASEVMAVLSLADGYRSLKERLGRIIVGLNRSGRPVTIADLKAVGAMAALLREALMPNLVQTLEGTPAFVHGGPFANIAHGTSSILATRLALARAEVVVQEAGFGADLGAEKFLDIFCRELGRFPDVAVVVATRRALAQHGEENLRAHLDVLARFGLPAIVALNEVEGENSPALSLPHTPVRVFQEGGPGALDLGRAVLEADPEESVRPLYPLDMPLADKLELLAREVYGAGSVEYSGRARTQLDECSALGFENAYVCVAKTQSSLSGDPGLAGRPRGFPLVVRAVYLLAGARFVVPVCGEISTMPGLGRKPNLESIDLTDAGEIVGL